MNQRPVHGGYPDSPPRSTEPVLDTVLTIAIGGIDHLWSALDEIEKLVIQHGGQVFGMFEGFGFTSDTEPRTTETSGVVLVGNVPTVHIDGLRRTVAEVLRTYGTTSACFAIDPAHEPVWNTTDGARRI